MIEEGDRISGRFTYKRERLSVGEKSVNRKLGPAAFGMQATFPITRLYVQVSSFFYTRTVPAGTVEALCPAARIRTLKKTIPEYPCNC